MASPYLQFDPRLPRAQAPRGLAPQNAIKQAAAGSGGNSSLPPWLQKVQPSQNVIKQTGPGSIKTPFQASQYIGSLPQTRPQPIDFGSVQPSNVARGITDRHGPLAARQVGHIWANVINDHPLGTDYMPDGTPFLKMPNRGPFEQGVDENGQSYKKFYASAPAGGMPPFLTKSLTPSMPAGASAPISPPVLRSPAARPLPPINGAAAPGPYSTFGMTGNEFGFGPASTVHVPQSELSFDRVPGTMAAPRIGSPVQHPYTSESYPGLQSPSLPGNEVPSIPSLRGGATPPAMPNRSDYYPTAPAPTVPFPGSPIARQGSAYFPSTVLGQMDPYEARAQVPSLYGTGDANGYTSRSMGAMPTFRAEIARRVQRENMAPSAIGPYGSLGGSSGRLGAMQQAVAAQPQQGAPQHHAWNPALMAQIQQESREGTSPRIIEQRNLQERTLDPVYMQRWRETQARRQETAQGLASNRRDAALARGIAQSRSLGVPLTPMQNDFIARTRQSQAGEHAGPGDTANRSGTGLNAPPRPFAELQPTAKVNSLTPEREQELLSLLDSVNDGTPTHELHRLRGMVEPGELEYLSTRNMPWQPIPNPWTRSWGEFNRLSEKIRRLRGTYRTPEQRQQDLQQSIYDAARSNSMVQF
ncbi:hypothetical protein Pan44_53560 [Caulifigura coniformis]|uniref:Uncharacterized protein n=1 Tax=Caulifigura coniformis TaxID=2527983 RepID=A0A517SMF0_9PLAN|nr:hypothetical protein [Caulifigura coniformis]QDT57288.1 hypothetical protein Pan44_53560 [Caulifigura coniformis]